MPFSPTLPLEYVANAFARLETADVVLGPATDGGYYLLGCGRRVPPIFDRIAWGTNRALADTIAAAMSSPFGVGGSAFRTVRGRTLLVDTVPFPAYTRAILDRVGPFDEELVRNQPKVVFLDPEHGSRKRRHLAAAIRPFLAKYNYTEVNDALYLRP